MKAGFWSKGKSVAESLAHKWGQVIGNLLQASIRGDAAKGGPTRHGLYLDYQKVRAARPGKKVAWQDRHGNLHDLDYVLERAGTETAQGLPAAFIETAWRRYTKHSRNKAQEIQGAILALAETYSHLRPFLGVVVAGVFTRGSLDQLRSCGFTVAYIPYDTIVGAFAAVGIDASFTENTEEAEFRQKVQQFEALVPKQVAQVKRGLFPSPQGKGCPAEPPSVPFVEALNASLARGVQGITVVVLTANRTIWRQAKRLRTSRTTQTCKAIRHPR